MIEYAIGPFNRVVADSTGCGESGGGVIGVARPCIVCLMARETVGWSPGKLTVDVAARAWNGHMRASQRECCLRVIEHSIGPFDCVVADRAVRWESSRNVTGIRRSLEIRLVA